MCAISWRVKMYARTGCVVLNTGPCRTGLSPGLWPFLSPSTKWHSRTGLPYSWIWNPAWLFPDSMGCPICLSMYPTSLPPWLWIFGCSNKHSLPIHRSVFTWMFSGAVTKLVTSSAYATAAVFVVRCLVLMPIMLWSNRYSNGFKTKANSSMLNGQPCLTEHRMGKDHSFIPQSALDSSTTSSKASSPKTVIQCFRFQFSVSSVFLMVIR